MKSYMDNECGCEDTKKHLSVLLDFLSTPHPEVAREVGNFEKSPG
jgi:hypothetical protein